jgi:hypothetical protein
VRVRLIDELVSFLLERLDGKQLRAEEPRIHQHRPDTEGLDLRVATVLYPAAKAAFAMSFPMPRPAPVTNSTSRSFVWLIAFSLYPHAPSRVVKFGSIQNSIITLSASRSFIAR